ncbi:hypothetical protein [Ruegeria sp.]|uniref:hypothetical protein n=1 Tax=Ruegeria sp. TaxID=1879320 RepID=UPI003B5C5389
MPGLQLTDEWQDGVAGLNLEDGKSYVVEFHGPPDTRIYALDVKGTDKPGANDHQDALVHFNRDRNPRVSDPMEFRARADWTWWLRTDGGIARLVVAEI